MPIPRACPAGRPGLDIAPYRHRGWRHAKIGRVKIVFAMRWGLAVSATGQTGQSDAIHSPEACASMVVRLTTPPSIAVV
jgi:hypothetical protein